MKNFISTLAENILNNLYVYDEAQDEAITTEQPSNELLKDLKYLESWCLTYGVKLTDNNKAFTNNERFDVWYVLKNFTDIDEAVFIES